MHPRPLPEDFKDREERLLSAWRQGLQPNRFFADGAVDPDAYTDVPTRVVFVLRETNEDEPRDWDLREFLRGGAPARRPLTWCNVARWTRAILNGLSAFEAGLVADRTFRQTWLRQIAAVNLNKSGGSSTSDLSLVRKSALTSRAHNQEQIELLDPDLVICCGSDTGDVFREVIDPGPSFAIVDISHPAARKPAGEMHALLVERVKGSGVPVRALNTG